MRIIAVDIINRLNTINRYLDLTAHRIRRKSKLICRRQTDSICSFEFYTCTRKVEAIYSNFLKLSTSIVCFCIIIYRVFSKRSSAVNRSPLFVKLCKSCFKRCNIRHNVHLIKTGNITTAIVSASLYITRSRRFTIVIDYTAAV